MTGGRVRRTDGRPAVARADGLVVRLADADLRVAEIGTKKRSAVHLVEGDAGELVGKLGPDPLDPDFGPEAVQSALAGQPRQLKSALTDQRIIAGLGNAWSDEILHRARLSPLIHTSRLTQDNFTALVESMRVCIEEGIVEGLRENYLEKLKADRRTYLRVHNRKGEPCYVCRTSLAAIHFGERTTTYCPQCQSDGRVYADRRLSRLLR
jgi:formamidopyrimidine-DNA glycosylase